MVNFFKKVEESVQHSSNFPGVHGSGPIGKLNAIIGTEQEIQKTNKKLAREDTKLAEALKAWAALETGTGEDLNDICTKVADLFMRLSDAEQTYIDGLDSFRTSYKSLRISEEDYEKLVKRKAHLEKEVEHGTKELQKHPDHKDKAQKEQHIANQKSELEGVQQNMATQEARLADLRRSTTQNALTSQAQAMIEFAQTMNIIAEATRSLAQEVPIAQGQPGAPRPAYGSQSKTSQIVQEATSKIDAFKTTST